MGLTRVGTVRVNVTGYRLLVLIIVIVYHLVLNLTQSKVIERFKDKVRVYLKSGTYLYLRILKVSNISENYRILY